MPPDIDLILDEFLICTMGRLKLLPLQCLQLLLLSNYLQVCSFTHKGVGTDSTEAHDTAME